MHSGNLIDHGNGKWTWKGEVIDFSTPWILRPWEREADSIATYHQERLFPFRNYQPER